MVRGRPGPGINLRDQLGTRSLLSLRPGCARGGGQARAARGSSGAEGEGEEFSSISTSRALGQAPS